jgi:hypothetical protein
MRGEARFLPHHQRRELDEQLGGVGEVGDGDGAGAVSVIVVAMPVIVVAVPVIVVGRGVLGAMVVAVPLGPVIGPVAGLVAVRVVVLGIVAPALSLRIRAVLMAVRRMLTFVSVRIPTGRMPVPAVHVVVRLRAAILRALCAAMRVVARMGVFAVGVIVPVVTVTLATLCMVMSGLTLGAQPECLGQIAAPQQQGSRDEQHPEDGGYGAKKTPSIHRLFARAW